jgi:hypothetical protein
MQQATATYTLMNGKSATTDAVSIRSNPVELTQQSAVIDGGRKKVVVAVVTATWL